MPEPKPHYIKVGPSDAGMLLSLWQKPNPDAVPVLLLHGASANQETFRHPLTPDPKTGNPRCLMDWLHREGFEPWLLDWRGNGKIAETELKRLRGHLDFDGAAEYDIPAALEKIHDETGSKHIVAVGHCMGAATLAQAIAGGHVRPEHHLKSVVLLAIGLFYEPAWDSRLKAGDHALERAWKAGTEVAVDPRREDWPKELDEIYSNWPVSMRQHPEPRSDMHEICNRVSFMFGAPYLERNLLPDVHRGSFLHDNFGAIPLRMYLHGAQNIRRGWAAKFDAKNDDDELINEEARKRFEALDSLTLITGAENSIWHRDSIDRMHAWLEGGRWKRNFRKVILRDYAHQDLLWGKAAHSQVFPEIRDGLRPAPTTSDEDRRRRGQPRDLPHRRTSET